MKVAGQCRTWLRKSTEIWWRRKTIFLGPGRKSTYRFRGKWQTYRLHMQVSCQIWTWSWRRPIRCWWRKCLKMSWRSHRLSQGWRRWTVWSWTLWWRGRLRQRGRKKSRWEICVLVFWICGSSLSSSWRFWTSWSQTWCLSLGMTLGFNGCQWASWLVRVLTFLFSRIRWLKATYTTKLLTKLLIKPATGTEPQCQLQRGHQSHPTESHTRHSSRSPTRFSCLIWSTGWARRCLWSSWCWWMRFLLWPGNTKSWAVVDTHKIALGCWSLFLST